MVILAKTEPYVNKMKSQDFGLARLKMNTVVGIIVASLIINVDFLKDIIILGTIYINFNSFSI